MDARHDPSFAGTIRQLFAVLPRRRRRRLGEISALMLVAAAAELLAIGSIVPFLSLLAGGQETRFGWSFELPVTDEPVITAALLFMAAVIIAATLRLLLAWSSQRFILAVGHDLSVEIQRRILRQPYAFHVQQNSSAILASLEKVQILIASVLLQLMYGATSVVMAAAIMTFLVVLDPVAAASAAIVLALLYAAVSVPARRRLARNAATTNAAYGQRIKIVQESLGGIRDIIVDGSHDAFLDAFRAVDRRFVHARASSAFIAAAPRFVIEAAGMILIAGLAIVLAGRDGLAGALPLLGVIALAAMRLLPLLQQLYQSWSGLAGNRAVIGEVLQFLRLPVTDMADESADPLPFREAIRVDHVSFTYPGRDKPAIHDLSLVIPRGARVALVGRTGSGKSTLADLLMGLLEPDEGRITIDGAPLDSRARRAWQRNIAHVPQAIFLADDSIAANIAFGRSKDAIDQDRIARAATTAQLDEVIAELPEGFDTRVGERGVRLSGGQRQRLGLARAICKQADVLVLDEATNALDRETETAVYQALDELHRQGRTIIIIAHRETTTEGCDLVIRLNEGCLIEDHEGTAQAG